MTVYENFFVEQAQNIKKMFGWRKQAQIMAKEALDKVFPDNGIDVTSGLDTLSIAQQQMVEIARAISDQKTRLLILDEPTSSLPMEQTRQLQKYLVQTAKEGMTYIYISHRLNEIMEIANYVYIMQNGNEKWQGGIHETSEDHMVKIMGERIDDNSKITISSDYYLPPINDKVSVTCKGYCSKKLKDVNFEAYGGQIVGLTGLEGNGQLDLLQDIFMTRRKNHTGIVVKGKVAYVAGDRKKEGIFPLWSIADNQAITKVTEQGIFNHLGKKWFDEAVDFWYNKLHIKSDGKEAPITSLSGGNQQKVLIARALWRMPTSYCLTIRQGALISLRKMRYTFCFTKRQQTENLLYGAPR
jgi:ribose transport system ATP-binding protein